MNYELSRLYNLMLCMLFYVIDLTDFDLCNPKIKLDTKKLHRFFDSQLNFD